LASGLFNTLENHLEQQFGLIAIEAYVTEPVESQQVRLLYTLFKLPQSVVVSYSSKLGRERRRVLEQYIYSNVAFMDYLVCHSEIMIFYEIYVIFNNSIVMKRLFCLSTAIFLCILMFSACVI